MEKIYFKTLELQWKGMLSKYEKEFMDQELKRIFSYYSPRSCEMAFSFSKELDYQELGFPNYDEFDFDTHCFGYDDNPVRVIYEASESDEEFVLYDYNDRAINYDVADATFIKPIMDATAIWTHEYLTSINSSARLFYYRDGDLFFHYMHGLSIT